VVKGSASFLGLAAVLFAGFPETAASGAGPDAANRPWGTAFPGVVHDAKSIKGFVEEAKWLSNFFPCRVEHEGLVYGSAEAAYQASKFPAPERGEFTKLEAAEAKKLAHSRKIDEAAWDARKARVMRAVVWAKFSQNPDLARDLVATDGKYLEETNWWDDEYWGVHDGKGLNMLGKILMETRARLLLARDQKGRD
jgi:ribA/ribD-fused uncharacterized protein